MTPPLRTLVVLTFLCWLPAASLSAQESLPPIPLIKPLLPPPGIEIPAEVRKELTDKLLVLLGEAKGAELPPDVEIFWKAVAFALKFGEFYDPRDVEKARWALAQAQERFKDAVNHPWTRKTGLVVRGYRSPIDGSVSAAAFERKDQRWVEVRSTIPEDSIGLPKRPRRQGPIDDAFLEPFLVATPSGKSPHPRVQQWIDFELEHFADRWQATFRGQLRGQRDVDVTREDMEKYHVICFGDATSNKVIADALAKAAPFKLPLSWSNEKLTLAGADYDAATHVPLMIYPNPLVPDKYIVLNSGPTFREAHDRTNSLQNPKLPDWAVIDITTHPSASAPGKVVAADFFDEQWQIKK